MRSFAKTFLLAAMATSIIACSKKEEKQTDIATFPLRGQVVDIDTAGRTVTISHHDIPNYMRAMTMPFKVKNPTLLNSVAVGDSVLATLAVSRVESWLETLTVLGPGVSARTLSAQDLVQEKLFSVGETFPDEALLNQDSRTIRFNDYRGKVLAITFIYTRCPLPDYCIRMSSHFAAIQKALGADESLNGKWHLLTVSFDPKVDRPEVLQRYARSYGADFRTWDFATDPDTAGSTIMRIAEGLGLMYAEDEGLFDHNLRTAIVDRDGTLVEVIKGNEWTPEEVAARMKGLILN